MSDNQIPSGETPPVEPTLPSETPAAAPSAEDYLTTNTAENGKLFGRFDDVPSALEHFRQQEVTHTNNMRTLKEEQRNAETATTSEQETKQAEAQRVQNLNALIPQFVQNNMQMTPELEQAIVDGGLSAAEVELGAYKVRDAANKAYGIVGGQEEYTAMMAWAGENLDDNTKAGFDSDIKTMLAGGSSVGSLAIEGLHARYKAGQTTPTQRIEGATVQQVTRGYNSQAEMFADMRAADRDPALRPAYDKKMSLTSDTVIYGR